MKVYNLVSVRHLGQATPKNNIHITPMKIKSVYERLGVNMETKVGYQGEKSRMPAPQTLQPHIATFLENLGVNWKTHVGK